MVKQRIGMIHNMARSGSTLMCKCLGCMEGVTLLSELHPRAWKLFNPIKQAQEWFGLLDQSDIDALNKQGDFTYAQAIMLIGERCRARGNTLVLRDWAHLDYIAVPFLKAPSNHPMLYTELADAFDIVRISTTRDPVTQWQSLVRLNVMQEPIRSGAFGLNAFLAGYRKYAELCTETGFVRYEDFLSNPESEMRKLCDHLQLAFDSGFMDKWFDYKTITGDIANPKHPDAANTPGNADRILPVSVKPVDPALKKQFLASEDYHFICESLGYKLLEP